MHEKNLNSNSDHSQLCRTRKRCNVRDRTSCKTADVVTPFQNAHKPPSANGARHTHDLDGHKGVVKFRKLEERLLFISVRIKPGAHQNKFGLEAQKLRNPNVVDYTKHIRAITAFRHRSVDDVARLSRLQSEWKRRFLIKTEKRDALVALDNVFRSVGAMHIEIHNGNAL